MAIYEEQRKSTDKITNSEIKEEIKSIYTFNKECAFCGLGTHIMDEIDLKGWFMCLHKGWLGYLQCIPHKLSSASECAKSLCRKKQKIWKWIIDINIYRYHSTLYVGASTAVVQRLMWLHLEFKAKGLTYLIIIIPVIIITILSF